MKAPKIKRAKGEAEHMAGNPYRTKATMAGNDPMDMNRPRNWYKKGPAPEPDMAGRYAYDDGRINSAS